MDAALIPTGDFEAVDGTISDLRNTTLLNDTVTVTKASSLCAYVVMLLTLALAMQRHKAAVPNLVLHAQCACAAQHVVVS